mmetsp:Transcript_51544/g.117315  ORF Transcript_51544/g.117315 Transcript_51544/m.117315 type:complete len:410 (-) Transcript_51544:524-1753(-)
MGLARHMFALLVPWLTLLPLTAWAYTPLGSEPPASCRIDESKCPSHYICLPTRGVDRETGVCECNRFFGFYGDECTKISAASRLLLAFSFLNSLGLCYCVWRNLELFWRLHEGGRLRFNAILQTLIFNAILPLPCLAVCLGWIVIILGIDENMDFHYVRDPLMSTIFLFFILSTLSVSIVWIEAVEKTAGASSHSSWQFRAAHYGSGILGTILIILAFYFNSVATVMLLGFIYSIFIGVSFHYAGGRVFKQLRGMQRSLAMEQSRFMIKRIGVTAGAMRKWTFCLSISFLGLGLTIPASRPFYVQQNELPRWFAGQLFFFLRHAQRHGCQPLHRAVRPLRGEAQGRPRLFDELGGALAELEVVLVVGVLGEAERQHPRRPRRPRQLRLGGGGELGRRFRTERVGPVGGR